MGSCSTHEVLLRIVRLKGKSWNFKKKKNQRRGGGNLILLTSSSLPPHISSLSWFFSSSSTWSSSIRAFKRSSLVCSISLLRFSLRKSSVSSGVKKKVSSVSEGRSDQPVGESGWDMGTMGFGRVSSRRRASYLTRKRKMLSLWVIKV